MNGGEISGFYQGGISVGKGAKFKLENGAISQILQGSDGGGGAINIVGGTATINGGTLSDSSQGIFNNSNLIMTGGDITGNQFGLINNNKDGMSGETFMPVAKLSGGSIANNEVHAIENYKGGTFTITGDAYVSGRVISNLSLFSKKQKSNLQSVIISNETGATLNIEGGHIESNSPNEIAIQNDNPNTKAVVLQDGSLNIGEGSNAMAGSGNTEVGGIIVNADGRVTVKGTSDKNGWVTPALTVAKIGDSVDFTIKAYPGYRILDVKVNGVSVGAVSQYTLVVTGADILEAQFVQASSSGSSGGSGGSGGSGRIITGNSATKPSIPETPGAWVQDQTGWKFNAPNQPPCVNTWIRSKNQWYWVGADSYMRTGWNQIVEKWYYLTPVTGEMKTGWLQDGDSWYYLDETGARKTGWLQDGTKWYYLNQDGKMAANTTTPDGYKVDGSGAWVK